MFLLAVTLMSMLLAAIMSVIAWRFARDERRRSEGRIAALAAEIHGTPGQPVPVSPVPDTDLELRPAAAGRSSSDLFARTQPVASRSRFVASVAIGLFMLGSAAALAIVLSAGPRIVANPTTHARTTGGERTLPLELVALGHEREGDRLTVHGVIRNPSSAARLDNLTAVVFLFNHDGGLLSSARAAIASAPLGPGGESAFVVTVPQATDVERYRVSFRTGDRIVPHIDRRHES
jgi:hypothetical protein